MNWICFCFLKQLVNLVGVSFQREAYKLADLENQHSDCQEGGNIREGSEQLFKLLNDGLLR